MDRNIEKSAEQYSRISEDHESLKVRDTSSPFKETLHDALLESPVAVKFHSQNIEMTKISQNKGEYLVFENEKRELESSGPTKKYEEMSFLSIFGTFQIILTYIITDIRKKPRSFKIGVFSIFIVVAFLIVLQSAQQLTPALFIRLSEGQAGDFDVLLRSVALENDTRLTNESYVSNPLHGVRLLNGINIERICDSMEELEGCSARWMFYGKTTNRNYSLQSFILIEDSQKEMSIGLGRNSKANAARLIGNECYLTESTRRSLNIQNHLVDLNIDILKSLVSQESLALGLIDLGHGSETQEIKLQRLKARIKQMLNETLETQLSNLSNNSAAFEFIQKILSSSNIGLFSLLGISQTSNIKTELALKVVDIGLDSLIDTLNLTLTLKIKDTISSPKGKWPSVLGNVVVIDQNYLTEAFVQAFIANFKKKLKNDIQFSFIWMFFDDDVIDEFIKGEIPLFNLKRFAMMEFLTFKNKLSIYSDEKTIDAKMVEFSNKLSKLLGKNYTIKAEIALSGVVKGMSVIKGFLENVFGAAVFLLLLLSILLIYSLMLSNVDEKTFEFGMLRALGFNKTHLIWLLVLQAVLYSFIGMFLAFLFSYLLNALICHIIYEYSLLGGSYQPTELSLILGFGIGLVMPVISNIFPIMRALSKTLRDSLDLFHREINLFRVRIMKLEKLGISIYQTLNGSLMVFMGLAAYYMAPKAFIMRDIALFLTIMNGILIIFLIGLTVFFNLFEGFFEGTVLKILMLFLPFDKKLKPIILKNIKGHHSRNIKTALMFSINMSFLIFAGTGFKLQQSVIDDSFKVFIGTDMTAEIPANCKIGLDEYKIRNYLEWYKERNPDQIASYSFVTIPFDQMPHSTFPQVSPMSFYPNKRTCIKAIEPHFLHSVYSEYFLPTQFDESLHYSLLPDGKRDVVAALSDPRNIENYTKFHDIHNISSNQKIRNESETQEKMKILRFLVPEGDRAIFGVEPSIPGLVFLGELKFPSKIATMIAKLPGFGMSFSSYKTAEKILFTSMENYRFLLDKVWEHSGVKKENLKDFYDKNPQNMTMDILKEKVFIKFARPLSFSERNELANGLRNQFTDMTTMLFDTEEFLKDTADAFFYLDLFYYIVGVISIILSFFLILVSFNSNVKEHVWEFGILRSLGLNKRQMTRIYIYEAVSLTIASGLIGTLVGIFVALLLTAQYLTFAEIPLRFHFPTLAFGTTFSSAIFTAVLGSYLALREIRDRPISNIMKGL